MIRKTIFGLITIMMMFSSIVWNESIKATEESNLQVTALDANIYGSVYASTSSSSYYLDSTNTIWFWGLNPIPMYNGESYVQVTPHRMLQQAKRIIPSEFSFYIIDMQDRLINMFMMQYSDDSESIRYSVVYENVKDVSIFPSVYRGYVDNDDLLWMYGLNENAYQLEVVLSDVDSFCASGSHTLALKKDKTLWAWGSNQSGEIGNDSFLDQPVPIKVMDDVASINCLNSFSSAIKTDGTLWFWGNHNYVDNSSVPTKFSDGVRSVSLTNQNIMIVNSDNSLWGLGSNFDFLISSTYGYSLPLVKIADDILSVSVGNSHAVAIDKNGNILTWGQNSFGVLGNGQINEINNPTQIGTNFRDISANYNSSLALSESFELFTWGWDHYQDYYEPYRSTPLKFLENVISFYSGYFSSLAIKSDNSLWGWGGRTSDPDGMTTTNVARQVYGNVKQVSAAFSYGMLLTIDDKLMAYGDSNYFGELGTGDNDPRTVAVQILENVRKVEVYDYSSYAILNDGSLWGWGGNFYGQLGLGDEEIRLYPVKIMDSVSDISATDGGALVLKEDGSVWLLGNPSFTYNVDSIEYSNSPRKIVDFAKSVSIGGWGLAYVSSDDSLWMLGSNYLGYLGTGNFKDSAVPVKVLDNVKKVEAAANHVLALKLDGTLWTWGDNTYGQLGIGRDGYVRIPTKIGISINQLQEIFIVQSPLKLHYLKGESIDLSGALLGGYNGNYNYIQMPVTSEMISGFDSNSSVYGLQTITVTYQGLTTSFEVYLNRFSDVPYGHRNYTHINALVGLGIINGYSDNTFRPNNTLTRAQAAIMIVRAIGLSTEGVSSNFTDVPPTHAAYKFISAAYQAGIINGYSDGTFKPNANVTRAQIAIMVQRAFNVQASETIITFTDVPEGYAPKKFIETLASQKIVNGYSDGTFKPLNNVTRAQFSTMIYNAIQYSQKAE
jgi:alpha-tubulin suppressor-like RCC1 family protein